MRKIFARAFLLLLMSLTVSCNKSNQGGSVNPNFPDIGNGVISPSASVDTNNQDQVAVIAPGADNQSGMIGEIADQEASHVFCVIADPANGQDVDLEVCDAARANTETASVNGICPDSVDSTGRASGARCASRNAGSGPDFCQVTGARDYVFVIMNLSAQSVTAAYQVVDVTGQPNKSCADLGITEETIQADDF